MLTSLIGHPRDRGSDRLDVTSYLPKDKNWGYERHQRPGILFTLDKGDRRDHTETRIMTLDGRALLDQDDHPILDWPHLPATISSQVTGQEIEYFRRQNLRVEYWDIIGTSLAMPSALEDTLT